MQYISDRLEKILNALSRCDESLTSEQLSMMVKVSTRTIKKDIAELNSFLKNYSVDVHAKTGVGYQLVVRDEFLYQQLQKEMKRRDIQTTQTIPKYRYERVNYIIKKLLTVDYYLTLEDLIDEMYISRSTLTADLKEVREIFKDYGLQLISRPNYGILLVGDEISKRLCIAEYFFHANVSTGYFAADNAMFVSSTNQNEITFVRDYLSQISEKYNIHLSDLSLQNFVIHILIAIRRWKFYNYVKIEDQEWTKQRKAALKEWEAAKELIERIEEKLEILLPEGEILYFALHLKSKHIAELDEISKEEIETVEKTLYDIYRMLQHRFNYIALNKDQYEQYLRLHIPAMISRLRSGLVMRNPMIYDILNKYLFSTHITLLISDLIEQNFNVHMNKNEFAYLILYTNLLFSIQPKYKTKSEKILLICGRGRPETITLLNEVNENFSSLSTILELCDVYELDYKDLERYEMIISTVPLDSTMKHPYIYLDGMLSYTDQIQTLIKNNRLNFQKVEKYFSSQYFNGNLKGSVRDEVFKEVTKSFPYGKELMSQFWDGEHIVSHETTRGIVFLHTLKRLPDEFIYIGFLRKPIIWNKQWAQTVIFVNINEGIDQLKLCYDFLLELMNDPSHPLINFAEDYDTLLHNLRKWKLNGGKI